MARRKNTEKNIKKLTRVGGTSLSVTLPVDMVRKLRWREKQKVVVSLKGKVITIKDWPRPKLRIVAGRPTSSSRGRKK